jgi:tetratricopeptide (TPR) repeat protein
LVFVLGLLRGQRDDAPSKVAREASAIYSWLLTSSRAVGVFDERDYFLAEAAFLAGTSCRLMGKRDESIGWLDRSEVSFMHTVNPAPGLANVAYARLANSFEMGQLDKVLDTVSSLERSFARLGMPTERAKCLLLEAMSLKLRGRTRDALSVLEPVRTWESNQLGSKLKSRIVSELGDLYQLDDRFDIAMTAYGEAMSLLEGSGTSQALADLRMYVGKAYRERGYYLAALEGFRAAAADYQELGLATRLAYLRVYIADTLLRLNRDREAEWEILAALPTIEEQKMVPEGFAAVALLRESVRRRKTDPNALRELREHLTKNA